MTSSLLTKTLPLTSIKASIFVSIYGNRLADEIPQNVPRAVVAAGLPASSVPVLMKALANGTAAAIQAVPGMTPTVLGVFTTAVKDSYSASFRTVYLSSLAFSGIALIAAFFTTDVDAYMTSFLNKRVDGTQRVESEKGVEMRGAEA